MIGSDWEWEYYSESDDDEHRSLYVYAEDWQLCKKQAFKMCRLFATGSLLDCVEKANDKIKDWKYIQMW